MTADSKELAVQQSCQLVLEVFPVSGFCCNTGKSQMVLDQEFASFKDKVGCSFYRREILGNLRSNPSRGSWLWLFNSRFRVKMLVGSVGLPV